ncbi:hypothetical protein [Dyadobacter sp. CY356]|uniref:hypothetical protein n=1 Tax=Dyadobacter sp. CY356 TaxID=2906442 RepID=UPI001F1FD958|nr:hypothetical protein [Dyadobacter sp. CY356]MCF0059121.1 hypothetical protein [Dyadobacter sp. CY356]
MIQPKPILIIVLCFVFAFGCQSNQQEREQLLVQRELAISKREKDFALKQADYNALIRLRDSLLVKKDTVMIKSWPESLHGLWSSRSVCRESNCSEYVIGDQRANQWEFVSDSSGLFTRVSDKDGTLVRIYSASYDSTGIKLHFSSDSSAAKNLAIHVDLGQANADLLKGMQTIQVNKACTAKFSVELTRATKR